MEKKVVEKNPSLKKVGIVFSFLSLGMVALCFFCNVILKVTGVAEPGTLASVITNFVSWVLGLFCFLGAIMFIPGIIMRIIGAQKKEITDNKEL